MFPFRNFWCLKPLTLVISAVEHSRGSVNVFSATLLTTMQDLRGVAVYSPFTLGKQVFEINTRHRFGSRFLI
jgi:hypothetical protein